MATLEELLQLAAEVEAGESERLRRLVARGARAALYAAAVDFAAEVMAPLWVQIDRIRRDLNVMAYGEGGRPPQKLTVRELRALRRWSRLTDEERHAAIVGSAALDPKIPFHGIGAVRARMLARMEESEEGAKKGQ